MKVKHAQKFDMDPTAELRNEAEQWNTYQCSSTVLRTERSEYSEQSTQHEYDPTKFPWDELWTQSITRLTKLHRENDIMPVYSELVASIKWNSTNRREIPLRNYRLLWNNDIWVYTAQSGQRTVISDFLDWKHTYTPLPSSIFSLNRTEAVEENKRQLYFPFISVHTS